MIEGDVLKMGQIARVESGVYEGLVGEVLEVREEDGKARVLFQGNFNGEPIDKSVVFNLGQLGRNDG